MKLLLPESWVRRRLGGRNLGAILKSVAFGIPLPLCSCSVIPFATALRQSGASKPSTLAFLIATPITGVDSIVATYGVFGWFFTLYRIAVSTLIALTAGVLSLFLERAEEPAAEAPSAPMRAAVSPPSPGGTVFAAAAPQGAPGMLRDAPSQSTCDGGCCQSTEANASSGFLGRLWRESVETIFADFAKALLLGIALGALLVVLLPAQMEQLLERSLWIDYLLVLAVSAPLYICATSSIPLGAAMLGTGFSPGAVFLFLTAGPATSMVTMSVVRKLLGNRSLAIYLATVLSVSLLAGWAFDTLFAEQGRILRQIVHVDESPGFVAQIAAVLLLALSARVLLPRKKGGGCCGG
ncbi:permease [Nitratifractor sp.]